MSSIQYNWTYMLVTEICIFLMGLLAFELQPMQRVFFDHAEMFSPTDNKISSVELWKSHVLLVYLPSVTSLPVWKMHSVTFNIFAAM